jgi:hypothetical protein
MVPATISPTTAGCPSFVNRRPKAKAVVTTVSSATRSWAKFAMAPRATPGFGGPPWDTGMRARPAWRIAKNARIAAIRTHK